MDSRDRLPADVATPALAWEAALPLLPDGPVFASPEGVLFLKQAAPERLPDAAGFEAECLRAVHDPEYWRQLDRRHRFAAVVLAGSPGGFKALLDHLISSPDWRMVVLDHAAIVFLRGDGARWSAAGLASGAATARFSGRPLPERLAVWRGLAAMLVAAGERKAGEAAYTQAIQLVPDDPMSLTGLAALQAAKRNWDEALRLAAQAIGKQPDFVPAWQVRLQCFLALGQAERAVEAADQLGKLAPAEPVALFLQAQAFRAVHDFRREREALEKLVDAAKAQGVPVAAYQVYLAQAYAGEQQPEKALALFRELAESRELAPPEREFVKKGIERLEGAMEAAGGGGTP